MTDDPKPRPRSRVILTLVFLMLVIGGMACLLVIQEYTNTRAWREPVLWIPKGQPGPVIADNIAFQAGLPSLPVKIALKLATTRPLQAGEYDLSKNPSLARLFADMQSGAFIKRSVTIPEGLTSYQILQKLGATYGLNQDCPAYTAVPEGSLLPETYAYTRGENCTALLSRMKDAMDNIQAKLWPARNPALPYSNWNEVVTMASIIEKETGMPAERPRVAGVFMNRLKASMPLQSDPTTIYALSNRTGVLGRALTRADWKLVNPYNTYTIPALPPGPIANPGLASLQAALNPEQNEYFYFVANGTGGPAFAKTLDEHIQNDLKR